MKKMLKKTIKWFGIAIAVVVVIVFVCLGVLTTPGMFMPEDKQYRAITVRTEVPIGLETDSIMAEVFTRLDAVPIYDPDTGRAARRRGCLQAPAVEGVA